MKYKILGITVMALSLISVGAAAANAPVVKKAHTVAGDEDKRAETLKEFPQYNYPVATISPAEVIETKVTESAGPVVDAQNAAVTRGAQPATPVTNQ